jgi:hypothetical protein
MKRLLAGGLGGLLAWFGADVLGDELKWHPVNSVPSIGLLRPVAHVNQAPAVALGRPVALREIGDTDRTQPQSQAVPASYDVAASDPLHPVVRGQSAEPSMPPPPPPPDSLTPANPAEQYNCGVANANPGPGHPILEGGRRLISGIPWKGGAGEPSNRAAFQSDPCFPNFISPVTNPFLFEDPRALTELRPIIIYQSIPKSNYFTHGGDAEFFGLQGRLALSSRWDIVVNKLGLVAIQPSDHTFLHDATSISEIDLGPKYTFLRNDACGTLGAVGVTFQIPAGSSGTFQDTGTLSIVPYLSMAQRFGKTSWGSFNGMGTVGYAFSVDDARSEYLFTSLHLDFNIADCNKYYPLVELNWFHYTSGGNTRNVGFEGRDLFNLGAAHVGGDDDSFSIAFGFRYKFSECIQTGIAAEFPLNGRRDLEDFRLTFDLIFRY